MTFLSTVGSPFEESASVLPLMVAVDNILQGVESKDNIWSVNTEGEYHEVACRRARTM